MWQQLLQITVDNIGCRSDGCPKSQFPDYILVDLTSVAVTFECNAQIIRRFVCQKLVK